MKRDQKGFFLGVIILAVLLTLVSLIGGHYEMIETKKEYLNALDISIVRQHEENISDKTLMEEIRKNCKYSGEEQHLSCNNGLVVNSVINKYSYDYLLGAFHELTVSYEVSLEINSESYEFLAKQTCEWPLEERKCPLGEVVNNVIIESKAKYENESHAKRKRDIASALIKINGNAE